METLTREPVERNGQLVTWLVLVFAPGSEITWLPVRNLAQGEHEMGRDILAPFVSIIDSSMSRRHFQIQCVNIRQSLFKLQDLGSKNGTYVNGVRTNSHFVSHGDVIRSGDSLFVVVSFDMDPAAEQEENSDLRGKGGQRVTPNEPLKEFAGRGPASRQLRLQVRAFSGDPLPVLLLGETGTGKEVVARALHSLSGRTGRLVSVNCASLPEALFESTFWGHSKGAFTGASRDEPGLVRLADRGTLFLDELGELSPANQSKLLRFLEDGLVRPVGATTEHKVDVRVVAATNADLKQCVARGTFRRDLLARLEAHVVHLPPLRQRREDIMALLHHWMDETGISGAVLEPDAAEALLIAPWPQNVRGIVQTAKRWAASNQPILTLASLPDDVRSPIEQRTTAATTQPESTRPPKHDLERLLDANNWSVQAVAAIYGKDRKQVYRWMEHYGMKKLEVGSRKCT